MTIDRVTANLFTCCKCKYQWTRRWNGNDNVNGDQKAVTTTILTSTMLLPKRCPKNIRWNQRYLDEELALIDRLQDELYKTGLIRESGERIEYEGNETLGIKPRTVYPYDYDYISYDFQTNNTAARTLSSDRFWPFLKKISKQDKTTCFL